MVAAIRGGDRTVGFQDVLALDGSGSYDPDQGVGECVGCTYEWRCSVVPASAACDGVSCLYNQSSGQWLDAEACTLANSEELMPVRQPLEGSWRLLDEGGSKGIAKLGFVSTRLEDTIKFSLGVLCAGDGTGTALVRIGYHMSTRAGQGALHLRCEGCNCRGLQGILSSVSPFPLVQTDVRLVDRSYFSLPGQLNGSLSVTASTQFSVQPSVDHVECVIVAQHVRSKVPRGVTSRVRLDSMAVSTKCPY